MKIQDYMNMSDEDIMNMSSLPPQTDPDPANAGDAGDAQGMDTIQGDAGDDTVSGAGANDAGDHGDDRGDAGAAGQDDPADPAGNDDDDPDGGDDPANGEQPGGDGDKTRARGPDGKFLPAGSAEGEEKPKQEEPAKQQAPVDPNAKPGTPPAPAQIETPSINYEEAYKKVMAPFKANGREVKLENIDEVIQLMQKGANYVRKMQAIQPNLRILKMLENNNLLNEEEISRFIDMKKGDKGAISDLIQKSGIDPLDINPEDAVSYKGGNHRVSDAQLNFKAVLDEVDATEHGRAVVEQIHRHFDQASQEEIFAQPTLMQVLTDHKSTGVYDQIAEIVERRKLLGDAAVSNLPFIHAYKKVGEELAAKGLLVTQVAQPATAAPQELARAPAPSKKTVVNGDQAKGASPSARSTKKAAAAFNPLAMSDEDFLNQMNGRV